MSGFSSDAASSSTRSNDPHKRRGGDFLDPMALGIRELVLFWCLWLLGSWVVTQSWLAAQRAPLAMVFAVLFGFMVAWPVIRLSEGVHWWPMRDAKAGEAWMPRPGWVTLLDWVALIIVAQAVVWPLAIISQWTNRQAIAVDVALCGWALIISLLIAWGCQSSGGWARTLAMLLCILLLLGGPLLEWLSGIVLGSGIGLAGLGPVGMLNELTGKVTDGEDETMLATVLPVPLAGLVGWVLFVVVRLAAPRQSSERSAS